MKEALLGFEREIKHLDDHIVQIKKDGVVQPGDVIKLRGEGMPVHQSSERGDLFVKIEIEFPYQLTEKQIESKIEIYYLSIYYSYFSCKNSFRKKILLVGFEIFE